MRQHLPRVCILLLLSCYACLSQASPPAQKADANYIGAQQCQTCHAAEFASWQHSDHDLAMQEATAESVLGDFDNASFSHGGLAHRFFKRGGQFWVNTDGPDGKLQDFRVEYVFGHTPLQQYLLALPGGRLQALGIAWDSRPATQGGHRWFHLQPEEQPGADNPLHWTGPYYNWNGRCAECHSTNLQKNFDSQSAQYATTWTEINVACEACHGPGRQHAELARTNALDKIGRAHV